MPWWTPKSKKSNRLEYNHKGGPPKIGGFDPPKWMVYFMENPIKIDDLGVPLFLETPKWMIVSSGETSVRIRVTTVIFFSNNPMAQSVPPDLQGDIFLDRFWTLLDRAGNCFFQRTLTLMHLLECQRKSTKSTSRFSRHKQIYNNLGVDINALQSEFWISVSYILSTF